MNWKKINQPRLFLLMPCNSMTLGRMIFAFFLSRRQQMPEKESKRKKQPHRVTNLLVKSIIYYCHQILIKQISTIWGSTLLFLSLLYLSLKSLTIYDPFLPEKCSWSTVLITSLLLKTPQRLFPLGPKSLSCVQFLHHCSLGGKL